MSVGDKVEAAAEQVMQQLDHLVGSVVGKVTNGGEVPGAVVSKQKKKGRGRPPKVTGLTSVLADLEAEVRQPRVVSQGVPRLLNEMKNKNETLEKSSVSEVADLESVGGNALLIVQ
ncbi:hypothetical protein V6N13_080184 [Hibiscus sabdariffa]|uniref:Uncharacterized protein n=1 Tax=Hibiscus sabdariffa TaxID=183260 RepID=A0ABR2PXR7_9ROSI